LKDKDNNISEVQVFKVIDDETDKEIKEWAMRWEESVKEHERKMKRFKIFATILFAFIFTILIAGIVGIFFPQFQYITDKYLFVCNLLSTGLSIWTIFNMFKTKLIKEKVGKWLLAVGIFAVIINLVSAYGNLF
jgi:hypothetical protein